MAGKKRKVYSEEFKAEAVRIYKESGRSKSSVAKDLDISYSMLSAWVKQADVDAAGGPRGDLKVSEREELNRLRRKVKQLEMEREILKKAAAFFARESS